MVLSCISLSCEPCQESSLLSSQGFHSHARKVKFSVFLMTRQPQRDHLAFSNEEGKEEEMHTSKKYAVINKCFLILAAH